MQRSYSEGDVRPGSEWPNPRRQLSRFLQLSTRIPARRASLTLLDKTVVSDTKFATSIIGEFCDRPNWACTCLHGARSSSSMKR